MSLKISGAVLSFALLVTAPAFARDVPAPVQTSEPAPDPATIETVAPRFTAQGRITAPPAGRGQIVFFRSAKTPKPANTLRIRESGIERGRLASGRYLVQVVPPGRRIYAVSPQKAGALALKVEEGKTYYVEAFVATGRGVNHARLSPSNAHAFEGQFKKLKPAS